MHHCIFIAKSYNPTAFFFALRVVTDTCQILWQYYLPDACVVVQFASWLSAKKNIKNIARIHTREVIKNALSTAIFVI